MRSQTELVRVLEQQAQKRTVPESVRVLAQAPVTLQAPLLRERVSVQGLALEPVPARVPALVLWRVPPVLLRIPSCRKRTVRQLP